MIMMMMAHAWIRGRRRSSGRGLTTGMRGNGGEGREHEHMLIYRRCVLIIVGERVQLQAKATLLAWAFPLPYHTVLCC